jgi:beta-glucanase (GH16 family)
VPNPLAGSNQVLSGTVNVPTWGGFGAAFMPPADWSDMVGVSFWFYGENSGTTHEFEIQTVAGDDRRATFDDNFVGWQYIVMPFNTFGGGGAYDVSQVDNWVFVLDGTIGSFKMDEVAVYGDAGNAALKVQFDTDNFDVMEGDTATISVTLNMTSTNTVMVDYATADGSADSADYTSASGTLTFAPGETVQTFTVDTTDDMEYEGDETVVLNLSGVVSATIAGSGSATLTIIDNEMPPPPPAPGHADIVDDFEMGDLPSGLDGDGIGIGFVTWSDGSPVAITTTTVADAGISPRPGADDTNTVLDLTLNINSWGGFSHAFENETVDTWVPQDWSSYEGFGIWIHGANNGSILFIDLIENRNPGSTTDDGERWTYAIDDDFTGWEYFAIPFDDFTRKEIGNGAPQDGWSGEEVHGWALGSLTTGGEVTYYVDDAGILLRTTTVDDFEDGQLPSGTDGDGVGIGFVTFQDGNSSVAIAATNPISDGIAQVPGRPDDNIALNLEMDVNTFAGFSHAFENAAVDTWVPQDWSTYEGVCFWIYGNNSGSTLFMDLIENRNPGSTTDDAERWSVEIADDFDGWQFMIIPFTDFNRKEIGNGAPNDGWTGEEAHGWALGGLNTGGLRSYYIDEFTIYGNTGDVPSVLEAEFAAIEYNVTEGASVDLTVALNTPPTQTVTISYVTAESIATPDRDFIPVMGELVFAPGETEKTITLQTLEDIKDEINERLIVQLTDIDGAEFGFLRRTTVLIEDNDATDPALVDDFEGFVPYEAYGNVSLGIMEIADDSPDALPMQGPWEQVLTVEYGAAGRAGDMNGFGRSFPAAEDWSAYQGMSVWVYGNNSGDTVTINLYDNQTMTTADTTPDTWELVWSDEFNGAAGTGPDPNTWTHELGDGALNDITGWGNGELQYYTDSTDNAAMDGNGNLVLTAKETDPNSDYLCWYGQCEYTSARLISAGKQAQQFGRIEIRAQVPFGQGIWPALWMLGTDIEEVGWPQTGEIDIMEYVGWAPNAVFGTLHGPGYSGGNALGSGLYDIGEPVADAYHEFSVEWQPGEVRWYIDGVNFFTADTTDTPLGDGSDWVYDHPFFFILNIAVGGNFPGNPDDTSTYPQTLAVDYVRLYQAADNAERFEATIVDDFNGWQKVVIPFSDFTRSEDQPVGAPDDGLTLTDVWGYGFEMPASSAPTLAGGNMMYFDQVHLELNTTPTDVSITGFGDSQSNGWLVVVTLLALIFVGFGYWQVRRFSMR